MESNISTNDIIEVDLSAPEIDVNLLHGSTLVLDTEPISGGGIDTYDADAAAEDILQDKSVYVKGKKLVGEMPILGVSDINVTTHSITSSVTGPTMRRTYVNLKINKPGYYQETPSGKNRLVEAVSCNVIAGKTITPTTIRQTVSGSGYRYFTSNVYVAGDSNLVPENIRKGITIFGVKGTYDPASDQ